MGRTKKNKVFDLFKTDFKITFFYKPSMEFGDTHYYLVLDDVIEVKIKIINNVIIIDSVISITQSYIKPLFDKFVTTIMSQSMATVIVSIMGDTNSIHQFCISHGAPVMEDEQYITVSHNLYNKWKAHTNDVNKYGFYVLSVSDDDPPISDKRNEVKEPKIVVVDKPCINKVEEPPKEEIQLTGNIRFDKIKPILKKSFPNMKFNVINDCNLECIITEEDKFIMEIVDNTLYIKDLIQTPSNNMNLVKIMSLMNTFEELIPIIPDIFIISVMNSEVYRLCIAKEYKLIEESQKLPLNNLFKQAFHGYGSYKIVINN